VKKRTPIKQGAASPARSRRKVPAKKKGIIIASSVLGVLVLLAAVAYLYVMGLIGNINRIDDGNVTIPSEYNPPTESLVNPLPEMNGITNILLLGVDARDSDSIAERSDSMMILTIDQIHGKIKLTSLQRDMLVYIPGIEAPKKINSANAYGGPLLAMRVVNETFRLNITKYMVINMRGMEQLIDLAGGVMIDVKQAEIKYLNTNIREENALYGENGTSPYLTEAGLQLLDGRQAVGYARIRKLDSDYKRMERQRTVLQAMLNAFLAADLGTKNNMITQGFGLITTNLSSPEILNIGLTMIPNLSSTIKQMQIPITGYFKEYSGDSWVNLCDFNGMIPLLHQFIFEESFDFDPVKVIPGAPNSGIDLPTPTPKPTTTAATTAATTETLPAETTAETSAETTAPTDGTATDTTPSATVTDATSVPTSAPTTPAESTDGTGHKP
jgi:polyisoprenyl-teichoic acid--peptidoglycan teichoic acid transferase